jgi:hypothetical protein
VPIETLTQQQPAASLLRTCGRTRSRKWAAPSWFTPFWGARPLEKESFSVLLFRFLNRRPLSNLARVDMIGDLKIGSLHIHP